ncbi:hypothetical protein FY528_07945 [Hymenobacter lutimineralis]|uniref:T9SS type A sorting domain-containing protein n=2 Tax=Hymenobacter lutimineralis TaxID=2606448 RepID=A0A5D6V8I7_9BACT|nr:hypothetical protein FY528_07945 [Hymenobacter lutimineralis]
MGTSSTSFTVQPNITGLSPTRNLRNAPAASNVAVTFSQPMANTTATQQAVRVFSPQRGGLMFGGTRGTATVSGSTITLNPTTDFQPGETVFVTTTTGAGSSAGPTLGTPHVHQFTTAVGGTGRGNFARLPSAPAADAGINPSSVAIGDVDGDGDLDYVTANNNSLNIVGEHTVSVRLNNGSGTFAPPALNANVPVGNNPRGVALGDLDGDGDLDFVSANYSGNSASVRFNDGAGRFTGTGTITMGTNPFGLALGDLDGDGDLDLLCANGNGGMVSVRFNNASGTFGGTTDVLAGSAPVAVAIGDVDSDGDLDFVAANYASNVSLRLNNGSGVFTNGANTAVGSGANGVALGDVNGDGTLDLVTVNVLSGTVSIRLNNGSGIFSGGSDPSVGSTPYSVALGDVDADGDLDIAVTNYVPTGIVTLLLNDGAGIFTAPTTNPTPAVGGSRPNSLALGDLDADGDLDIINTNANNSYLSTLLNQGAPTITSFTPTAGATGTTISITGTNLLGTTAITFSGTSGNVVTTGFTVASATSLTGVVVPAGAVTGPLTVTTAGGTSVASSGSFTVVPPLLISSTSPVANARAATATGPVAITFNQALTTGSMGALRVFSAQRGGLRTTASGSTTVTGAVLSFAPTYAFRPGETVQATVRTTATAAVGGSLATARVLQFTAAAGPGPGTFSGTANPAVASNPESVAAADVDGDGDLDILSASSSGNTVSVRLNDGSSNFTGTTNVPVGSSPLSVVAADVNGDGALDILSANQQANSVSVRLNDGSGNFSGTTNVAVGSQPYSVAAADVNGDGNLDILSANFSSNSVSVRLNDGSGNFTGTTNVAVGTNPISVVAADVDRDGDLDILAANFSSNNVSVCLNNGSGTFSGTINWLMGSLPRSVVAADVDGDGDLDMLTANRQANSVSVRRNDGFGDFSGGTSNVTVGNLPYSVVAADVNGDGALDILTANQQANSVSVRLNDGSGAFSGTTNVSVGNSPVSIVAADVDGDNDLDLLTASYGAANVSVRLNQVPLPVLTSVSPGIGVPGSVLTLTGANLTGTTTITFAGSAGPKTVSSGFTATATSISGIVVPAGARSGPITVTTVNGTSVVVGTVFFSRANTLVAGTNHTVAVRADGTLWAWGRNAFGQLGNNTTTDSAVPVQVGTGITWVSASAGLYHTVAVRADGTLWAWGRNAFGQLGNTTTTDSPVPVQVGTGTTWVSAAANNLHTVAVRADGTLWAWGRNNSGQLGNNSLTDSAVPVQVGTGTNWGSAAAGNGYTVAVQADGTLWAWGFNGTGQLGNNSTTNSRVPVQVGAATTWGSAAAGDAHTVGEQSCRAVWAWGRNSTGQVGDGTNTQRNSPVLVYSPISLLTFTPASAAPGATVVVTGTGLSGLTSLTVNGADAFASLSSNTATGFTFVVPAGATATGITMVGNGCGTASSTDFTVIVAPTLTAVSPAAELVGLPVTLTGTGFMSGSTVTIGGVAASVTYNSPTSLTAVVPAGAASGSSAVVVSTPGGSSPSTPAFTVLTVYDASVATCPATLPYLATGDGQWHYLLASNGQVVAALQDTRAALGSVTVNFRVIGPTGPVRQDGRGRYYLDRNFKISASGGNDFVGATVPVRFFALASELARLAAVDLGTTLAALTTTQYSGPNEDCDFANNDIVSGEFRTLAAPGSTVGNGVPWLVSEVAVADHFSEFYLTASSGTLPVELTSFTAQTQEAAVQLRWRTASETNSQRYDIERSDDGKRFEKIGEQAAQGTKTSATTYVYHDARARLHAFAHDRYYRLRQVDTDGAFSYSPVRVVTLGSASAGLALFPNPTRAAVTLTGAVPGAPVRVSDSLGRTVATATADAAGTAHLVLPAGLAAGVYSVRSGGPAQRLLVE